MLWFFLLLHFVKVVVLWDVTFFLFTFVKRLSNVNLLSVVTFSAILIIFNLPHITRSHCLQSHESVLLQSSTLCKSTPWMTCIFELCELYSAPSSEIVCQACEWYVFKERFFKSSVHIYSPRVSSSRNGSCGISSALYYCRSILE